MEINENLWSVFLSHCESAAAIDYACYMYESVKSMAYEWQKQITWLYSDSPYSYSDELCRMPFVDDGQVLLFM